MAIVDPFDKPSGIVDPFDKPATTTAQPEPKKPERSFLQNLGRQAGLTARAGIEGVFGPGEMITSGLGIAPPGAISRTLTRAGLPEPETGAERIAGAGAQGIMGAMLPTGGAGLVRPLTQAGKGISEALSARPATQAVSGALAGSAGQGAAEMGMGPAGQALASVAGGMAPFARLRPPVLTTKMDEAARMAKAAGYVLPPSEVNPTMINRIIEGWGGKTQVSQLASVKNQAQTDRLIRRGLGIAEDAPIESATLNAVREEAGKAYEAVKTAPITVKVNKDFIDTLDSLGGDYKEAAKRWPDRFKSDALSQLRADLLQVQNASPLEVVELVKKLRFDAKSHMRDFSNPDRLALGLAERKGADALEKLLDTNLEKQGYGNVLVPELKRARTRIAQAYDVEAALNEFTGNVDARKLATYAKRKPFSGELRDVANLGAAFRTAAKPPEAIGGVPGVNPLDVGLSLAQAAASGNPRWLATILGRPLLGELAVSPAYQKLMVNPPAAGAQGPSGFPPALMRLLSQTPQQ